MEAGHQGLTGYIGAKYIDPNKNSAKSSPDNRQSTKTNEEDIVPVSNIVTGDNIS